METVDIIKAVLDLGFSGVLLYFLLQVWSDRKTVVKEKDDRIKDLSDTMIRVVVENTKTQVELRESIKENTKATETLTSRVYEALNKR